METILVCLYFGFIALLFIGLVYAFVSGTRLAFQRNWILALLVMLFFFPVYVIWIGIELFLKELDNEDS